MTRFALNVYVIWPFIDQRHLPLFGIPLVAITNFLMSDRARENARSQLIRLIGSSDKRTLAILYLVRSQNYEQNKKAERA